MTRNWPGANAPPLSIPTALRPSLPRGTAPSGSLPARPRRAPAPFPNRRCVPFAGHGRHSDVTDGLGCLPSPLSRLPRVARAFGSAPADPANSWWFVVSHRPLLPLLGSSVSSTVNLEQRRWIGGL